MLSEIIVSAYEMLIEVSLWLFLLICIIAGWLIGDGFFGAIVGVIVGFVFSVMFFGAFLLLSDIRTAVRNIEKQ